MSLLHSILENKKTAVVLGHTNPDGDCVGSCLAVYNYLRDCFPQVDVTVYLDRPADKFRYLNGFDQIRTEVPESFQTDLCICLDSGDRERLGALCRLPYRRRKGALRGPSHHQYPLR